LDVALVDRAAVVADADRRRGRRITGMRWRWARACGIFLTMLTRRRLWGFWVRRCLENQTSWRGGRLVMRRRTGGSICSWRLRS